MRTLRLWCEELSSFAESSCLSLEKSENHHFVQVLRGRIGDEVELLNGKGWLVKAVCQEIEAKKAVFKLTDLSFHRPSRKLMVMSPAPKGKRLPYMLEKFQELGVHAWQPMETEHSVRDDLSEHQISKLNERLKEACKQSGCPWKLKIEPMINFEAALNSDHLFALDIGGVSWQEPSEAMSELSLMIGPEAGWSDSERQIFEDRKIPRIGLSKYHLRMETAATIGAARLLESESF